jgi:nucleotide-binding universal stress UspA family protein
MTCCWPADADRPTAPWILCTASYLSSAQETEQVNYEKLGREAAQGVSGTAQQIARDRHPQLKLTQRTIDGPAVDVLASAAAHAGLLVVGSRGHGATPRAGEAPDPLDHPPDRLTSNRTRR